MNVGEIKRYLRMIRGSTGGVVLTQPFMATAINEAVRQAAMILVDAKDPWLLTAWDFDIVSGQAEYLITAIAAQQAGFLGDVENVAKPHSLHVLSEDGRSWCHVPLVDRLEASKYEVGSSSFIEVATYAISPGSGTSEHDYRIEFPSPPNYSAANGGRLSLYVYPATIPDDAADDFEPALPQVAARFVKLAALKEAAVMTGNYELAANTAGQLIEEERRLRMNAHGGIGDDPQYVPQNMPTMNAAETPWITL